MTVNKTDEVIDIMDRQISLPVSSRSLSGLRLRTELRLDGMGKLGFGRFFIAANACCTASWRTSTLAS